jgi:hypothetical protein
MLVQKFVAGLFQRVTTALLFFLVTIQNLAAQETKQLVIGQQPVYKVAKTTATITVDGKMDEAAWNNAQVVSFDNFFRTDKPADKQKTKFRMMWDSTSLYLFYDCEDTSLTVKETKPDLRPYLDDCAEFFVVPIPDSVNMHFGFEINLNLMQAAYDYIVLWKYYNNRTFFISGYNPSYKVAATYEGTINNEKDKDKGWKMEFQIPFAALSNFQLFNRPRPGVKWAFQAVRQDRNLVDDRFRSTSTLFPIYDFRADVHQPAQFGLLEFGGE